MASSYTNLLGLVLPVEGELEDTWGDTVNQQLTQLLDDAVANAVTLNVTSGDVTLTSLSGAADQARMAILIITGTPGVTRTVTAPSKSKIYQVINQSNSSVVIKGAATTGVTILAGASGVVAWNGSDFIEVGAIASNRTVAGNLLVGTTSASGTNLLQVNSDALINGVSVGRGAGAVLSNTAVGASALASNTTGSNNTANGVNALRNNTTGNSNTANGVNALFANTTGGGNTANGVNALYSNTTGFSNTANGAGALYYNTTGSTNTANGFYALFANTTGSNNTANGERALYSNTTGFGNTANGVGSLYSNTTGSENTANGYQALYSNTTGNLNNANGLNALYYNTTGSENTANGVNALYYNTTGSTNTANGFYALFANTTGSNNTANGANALYSNTTGNYNTANGERALYSNTTGSSNTANGFYALYSNTTGSGNTALSPMNSAGSYAPVFNPTTENNRFCMGSTGVTNAYIQVAWTVVSDARDKTDFATVPHGLAFINQLKPIAYRYKIDRDATEGHGPVRYGFKAQDVLEIEGDNPVIVDAEDETKLRFNDQSLLAVMVNAIQEQQALIDAQKTAIESLTARITALESK